MFWFAADAFSSSSLSCGSLNSFHHSPRLALSLGCACFQVPAAVVSGVLISLYADGVCTEGRVYFGPTTQPVNDRVAMAKRVSHGRTAARIRGEFELSLSDVNIDQFTRVEIHVLRLLDFENDGQHPDIHALFFFVR